MAIYNLNLRKLALLLLPIALRKKTLTALLYAVLRPLESLQFNFDTYRLNTSQHLCYTPQVCSLLQVLAYEFNLRDSDNSLNINAFAITDTPPIGDWVVLYSETHDIVSDDSRVVLRSEQQIIDSPIIGIVNPLLHSVASMKYYVGGFTVHCPSDLYTNHKNRIISIVNTYRLAGTNPEYVSL